MRAAVYARISQADDDLGVRRQVKGVWLYSAFEDGGAGQMRIIVDEILSYILSYIEEGVRK